MAIIIDRKVKEGFAYEAAKIAVTTGQNVEAVYENLMENYKKALNYIDHKEQAELNMEFGNEELNAQPKLR